MLMEAATLFGLWAAWAARDGTARVSSRGKAAI